VNLTEVGIARVAAMSISVDAATRPMRCLCRLPDDVAPPGFLDSRRWDSGRAYPHGIQVCGFDVGWRRGAENDGG
jgi:hypothetical protein